MTYRRLLPSDKWLVYKWSTESTTRKNSLSQNDFSEEEHSKWFDLKMADENAFYLICLHDDEPISIIRYDIGDAFTLIGINIDKEFRGRGLGATILSDTLLLYFENSNKPILAYIKLENIASIRIFEKAGYKFVEEAILHEQKALIYELKSIE